MLRHAACWTVAAAVVLAPWCFGAADPWAYLLLGSIVGLGSAAWLFSLLCAREPSVRMAALTAVLAFLLAAVGLQSLSLPMGLVRALNPFSAGVQEKAFAVLRDVGAAPLLARAFDVSGGVASLSVSPGATRRSLGLLAACLGIFLVLANCATHWRQVRRLAVLIVVSGFAMALVAIAHKFSGSREIFWFHAPRYGGDVFGPFANRNHFAGHMNLVFGAALGLFLCEGRFGGLLDGADWRERVAWLSSRQASRLALSAMALMLIAAAVGLSLSRGAMVSLAAALALGGIGAAWRLGSGRAVGRAAVPAAAALAAVGAGVWWMAGREAAARVATLAQVAGHAFSDFRFLAGRDTLRVFAACPVFGSGFGSFRHVFPVFQGPPLSWRWLHAHNDWAQLLAEGGAAGALLFALAILLWLRCVGRLIGKARRRAQLFTLGAVVGLAATALHGLFDYGMHKPANAFLAAALAGLCAAAVHLPREDAIRPAEAADGGLAAADGRGESSGRSKAASRFLHVAALAAILLSFLWIWRQLDELRGELAFMRFLRLAGSAEQAAGTAALRDVVAVAEDEAEQMLRHAGQNPDALREVAEALFVWAGEPKLDRVQRARLSRLCLRAAAFAAVAAPSDYLAWVWLARVHAAGGYWDEADLCMERARSLVEAGHDVRMFRGETESE